MKNLKLFLYARVTVTNDIHLVPKGEYNAMTNLFSETYLKKSAKNSPILPVS